MMNVDALVDHVGAHGGSCAEAARSKSTADTTARVVGRIRANAGLTSVER